MNGPTDPLIGSTATELAFHCRINVGIGWLRLGRQESGGRHDLARLAPSALGNFLGNPGLLDGVVIGNTFDGHDAFPLDIFHLNLAGMLATFPSMVTAQAPHKP